MRSSWSTRCPGTSQRPTRWPARASRYELGKVTLHDLARTDELELVETTEEPLRLVDLAFVVLEDLVRDEGVGHAWSVRRPTAPRIELR